MPIDISHYLKDKSQIIEEHLDKLIPEKKVPYNLLFQAARYSLIGGGKRIRPLLALVTAETLGCSPLHGLSAVCALEMIHTYSLIHDDLPCMDDDDYRRGKPSLHKKFPEGHAVLTGDFLLTLAFDVLANDDSLSPQQRLGLIQTLSKHAGGEGMIAGQVLDLASEGKNINLETLQLIHRNKTGAMIAASIQFGAIIAGASQEFMGILYSFGEDIGLAFQIVDDILDVTASQKHGKYIASDVVNNKATYVTLLGLDKSQQLASDLLNTALNKLKALPVDATLLTKFAQLIVNRSF